MFSKINGFATAKSLGVAFSLAVVLSIAFIAPTNAFAFDGYELESSYSYGYDNWTYDVGGCYDCYSYDYGCYDCSGGYSYDYYTYDDYYYTDYYSYDCCYSVGGGSSFYYPNTTYTYPSYNYSYPTSYSAPTYYTAPPVPDRMTGSNNSNPMTVVNNIDNSINDSFNTYTNSFNSGSFNAISVSSGTKSSDISAAAVEVSPTTVTVAAVTAPVTTGYVQPVSYSQSWYGASNYYTPTYTAPVTTSAPYVALSQIPYTGFDLGPMGNAMYWVGLALFALAGAYLVVFYRGGMFAFASQMMGERRNPIRVTLPVAAPAMRTVVRETQVQNSGAMKDSLSMVRVGGMPQLVVSRF